MSRVWDFDADGQLVRVEEPQLPGMPPDPRVEQPGMVGRDHPWTARAAAELVAPKTGTQRWRILLLLLDHPQGLTADEVCVHLGLPQQTVGPRMKELRDDDTVGGWLVETGATRPTRYGRLALVWTLAPGAANEVRRLAQQP